MNTFVLFVLFCMVALTRPDIALVFYFFHWAYCKAFNKPTLFDRIGAAFKRAFNENNSTKE